MPRKRVFQNVEVVEYEEEEDEQGEGRECAEGDGEGGEGFGEHLMTLIKSERGGGRVQGFVLSVTCKTCRRGRIV